MENTKINLTPQLGLSEAAMKKGAALLEKLLADEFVLRTKLQKAHWNVTGMAFGPLHALFEAQYDHLGGFVDDIAERVRQYGEFPIGTLSEFLKVTRLHEEPGVNGDATQFLHSLLSDHEAIIRFLRADIGVIQEKVGDIGLEDFYTGLIQDHQKMAWFLRSHLE